MKTHRVLALFQDFDMAFKAILDIRGGGIHGVNINDVTLNSPIEHPDVEQILGDRPAYVSRFAFFGALIGAVFGFIFLASAQAEFMVQPLGGKPVIPLTNNIVLIYEMFIFFGVWAIFFGFMIMSGLLKESIRTLFNRKKDLYSEHTSLDQVAVIVETDELLIGYLQILFKEHHAVDIKWEKIE